MFEKQNKINIMADRNSLDDLDIMVRSSDKRLEGYLNCQECEKDSSTSYLRSNISHQGKHVPRLINRIRHLHSKGLLLQKQLNEFRRKLTAGYT